MPSTGIKLASLIIIDSRANRARTGGTAKAVHSHNLDINLVQTMVLQPCILMHFFHTSTSTSIC